MRFVLFVILVLAAGGAAAGPPAKLAPGGSARAVEIVDGDTLVLDDGRQVRLVGIQAPKLPLGRPNFKPWPLGDAAKDALAALTLGKVLTLSYGGRRTDRHGRALAHLHDAAGTWVQERLLRDGMARVYSFADNRAVVGEMLAAERDARAANRGIWGDPFYRIRTPDNVGRDIGTFQLVEGRIRAAATVRNWTYLNFGADWRRDFTISVGRRARRLFEAAGIALDELGGRHVRVRGWVKSRNGPMIEVSHPEQLEIFR